jgi:beta-glucosidase
MSKQAKKPIVFWVLTGAFTALSATFGIAFGVTDNYKTVINQAFGLDGEKKVEVADSSKINSQYYSSDYANTEELKKADKEIAEELTEEGSVLLKNDNEALPLSKTEKVTILGHSSCNMLVCGTGSADINADGAPTLNEALTDRGISVNQTAWDYYVGQVKNYPTNPQKGDNSIRTGDGGVKGSYTVNEIPYATVESVVGSSFNEYNDAAIIVISRLGGEMYDLPADTDHQGNASETENGSGNSLELTINEKELITQAKSKFKKVIVLINSANALECDFLTSGDSKVDAALWIGYTGQQGLLGVADLLVGNSTPSGRLVDTYCNDNTTAPSMENFYSAEWTNAEDTTSKYKDDMKFNSLDGNKYYNAYQEGIYVGYRYYETRYEDMVYGKSGVGDYDYLSDVAYPFGYGLSYTTFEYSKPEFKVNEKDDTIEVTVTVKNTGKHKGKEVVEVYFQSEYTDYDKANGIEKASVELCGFAKTKELEPNATEKVTISVNRSEFATYDSKGKKTYILDAGDYYLSVGRNAHDALNNIIAEKGSGANSSLMKGIGDESAQGDKEYVYSFTQATIDDEKYAYGQDGNKITNQFDSASLSYYGLEDMTYLSRSNWTGTWPSKVEIALNDKLHDEMTGIKAYEKVTVEGEKLPTMGANNGKTLISMRGKTFDDSDWDALLDQLTYDDMCNMIGIGYHGLQGVTSVSKPKTKDENGPQGFSGKLTDLTGKDTSVCAYTDENIMGATWNTEFMEKVGKHLGEDGLALGYSGLYGPAMNTHRSAYSGRNFEYYSEDGFLAGKIAAAEVKGIQSKGVYVFVKHFALNDEETNCRSISTFANEQAIREIYLKPFQLAITEGGAHNVMTAFSRVGVVWSSAHYGLMTTVLRGEWGMDGFAISDYTTSGVTTTAHDRTTYDPYLAVLAGTDTFDSSAKTSQYKALKNLDYENDPHFVLAMRNACKRILYTVVNSNAMNGITDSTILLPVMTWWQMALIDGIIYCGIAAIVFLVLSIIKQKKYSTSKQIEDVVDASEGK